MQHTPVRRLLAGLAVAGAVIGMGSAPAFAAPKAAEIAFYLSDITVPIAEDGAVFSALFWATEPVTVEEPTVTFELSAGLTGVRLSPSGDNNCEPVTPTKLVCAGYFPLEVGPEISGDNYDGVLIADATAEPGAVGTVTATLAGKDVKEVTTTFKARVAEAVDLRADFLSAPIAVAPGKNFAAPYGVTNTGDKPVVGASALFFNDYAFQPEEQFSNCRYAEGQLRSCIFDQSLAVGSSYRAEVPFKLRADTRAPGGAYGEIVWLTPAELEDYQKYFEDFDLDIGTPGAGGKLALTDASVKKALRVPQADKHPDDNWAYIEVSATGKNGVDLAAAGSKVTGKAGTDVKVTAGVKNVGKATLDLGRLGSPAAVTEVHAPTGTTFKTVPDTCYEREGHPYIYECYTDYIFKPGQAETYEFVLHIDRVVPNAKGVVEVNAPCECERFLGDINKANNKAVILVNKKATGTGGGGGDDVGSTLPITGPAGASIAVGGLVLLGLGVAAVFFTRRRPRVEN